MSTRSALTAWAVLGVVAMTWSGSTVRVAAQVEMPALTEMSGIPLPTSDLDDGVISVRLIRGQLSDNVTDHPVELHGAGDVRTARTDEAGRAQFVGVPAGSSVHAIAEVDGQRLESQVFPAPVRGGVRIMLVAVDAAEASGAEPLPARPGSVAFGGESRFVLELGEDNLEVYYLLDIANGGAGPIAPDAPVRLDLPGAATGVTLLQGSTTQARLLGSQVVVEGPFQSGLTHLELAYFLPYGSGDVTVAQPLPIGLTQLSVVAQRPEGMQLESAQLTTRRDANTQGRSYIVATGPGLDAGATLRLELSGLPHHSPVPRTMALVAALAVLVVGFWAAFSPPDGAEGPRLQKLEARRETLFAALMRLEEERRQGGLDDARYAARRGELIAQLERVYRSLDETAPA